MSSIPKFSVNFTISVDAGFLVPAATSFCEAEPPFRDQQRNKVFPIGLVSVTPTINNWSGFDADTGKDLAVELSEHHIPDFSNWKYHAPFESAFADLLRDLRAPAANS